MHKYTIIIEKAGDNYSAYCPDLPGCIATGPTVEETTQRMKQTIEFHIEGLKREKMAGMNRQPDSTRRNWPDVKSSSASFK